MLIMPDHPTPVSLRTHSADPVPFCIYGNKDFQPNLNSKKDITGFNEVSAKKTGVFVDEAHRLLEIMIKGKL